MFHAQGRAVFTQFLEHRDDLVCIILLKLSTILFMNSDGFSKMPLDKLTARQVSSETTEKD